MTSARVAAIEAALQPGAHEEPDHRARIRDRVVRGTAVPAQASRVIITEVVTGPRRAAVEWVEHMTDAVLTPIRGDEGRHRSIC